MRQKRAAASRAQAAIADTLKEQDMSIRALRRARRAGDEAANANSEDPSLASAEPAEEFVVFEGKKFPRKLMTRTEANVATPEEIEQIMRKGVKHSESSASAKRATVAETDGSDAREEHEDEDEDEDEDGDKEEGEMDSTAASDGKSEADSSGTSRSSRATGRRTARRALPARATRKTRRAKRTSSPGGRSVSAESRASSRSSAADKDGSENVEDESKSRSTRASTASRSRAKTRRGEKAEMEADAPPTSAPSTRQTRKQRTAAAHTKSEQEAEVTRTRRSASQPAKASRAVSPESENAGAPDAPRRSTRASTATRRTTRASAAPRSTRSSAAAARRSTRQSARSSARSRRASSTSSVESCGSDAPAEEIASLEAELAALMGNAGGEDVEAAVLAAEAACAAISNPTSPVQRASRPSVAIPMSERTARRRERAAARAKRRETSAASVAGASDADEDARSGSAASQESAPTRRGRGRAKRTAKKNPPAMTPGKDMLRKRRCKALLDEIDVEVEARCQLLRSHADSLAQEMQHNTEVAIMQLPAVVRNMSWTEFQNSFGGSVANVVTKDVAQRVLEAVTPARKRRRGNARAVAGQTRGFGGKENTGGKGGRTSISSTKRTAYMDQLRSMQDEVDAVLRGIV